MASNGRNRSIKIHQMEVDDIPPVYHMGNALFRDPAFTTLYRTWDAYEVTTNFNQDPELCLVAENADGKVVGFALGTTYEKEGRAWMYGYLGWLGVDPEYQRERIGSALYREMERRMRQQGARMILVDTADTNPKAIKFFKNVGFGKPSYQVWLSKLLRRSD